MDDVTKGVVIGAVAGGIPAVLQTVRELAQAFRERKRVEAEAAAASRREARERRRQAFEVYLHWRNEIAGYGAPAVRASEAILARLQEARLFAGHRVQAAIDALAKQRAERAAAAAPGVLISLDEKELSDAMRDELGFGDE